MTVSASFIPIHRFSVLLCFALVGLACSERAGELAPLEAHFPGVAERVFAGRGFVRAADGLVSNGQAAAAPLHGAARRSALVLPDSGEARARLTLGGLSLELRELDLEGPAREDRGAVVYARKGGRSFWAATPDGYEEWIERLDAGEGPVAEWEVSGATLHEVDGAVMLVDAQGLGLVRVEAPAAWTAGGQPGRAWLRAEGQRLSLHTDLRGHVLVDPLWTEAGGLPWAIAEAAVTMLLDGSLLLAGGDRMNLSQATAARYDPSTGRWSATGSMGAARRRHTATLLRNGQVLVTGGIDDFGTTLQSAELYNPVTGTWTPTMGALTGPRNNHTATLLADGRVLIAGGVDTAPALNTSELFNPSTRTFAASGNLVTPRYQHRAVRLQDGTVLAISGSAPQLTPSTRPQVERYNPTTGQWTATGALSTGRVDFSATLLPSGDVLVAGGTANSGAVQTSCERYDPGAGLWTATGALATARRFHTANLLPTGRVLVAGGSSMTAPLQSAELYDPTSGTWASGGSLLKVRTLASSGLLPSGQALIVGGQSDAGASPAFVPAAELFDSADDGGTVTGTGALSTARREGAAVPLPSGQVLVIGGADQGGATLATCELYSPTAGTWSGTGAMTTPRRRFAAALLAGGKVLVSGGHDGASVLASAEVYDPATGTWSPTSPMSLAREQHTLTTRLDGTAVAVGGMSGTTMRATPEIYAPHTGTWTNGPVAPASWRAHTATLLATGGVLIAGGYSSSGATPTGAYAAFNGNGTWTGVANMTTVRALHTATLLPSGRVLLAGGLGNAGTPTGSAHVYDPTTGSATPNSNARGTVTNMNPPRAEASAVLLPNGKVLLTGGRDGAGLLGATQLYDPLLGTFRPGPPLATPRASPGVALLPSGRVLIAGGTSGATNLTSTELYDEGRDALPAMTPTLTASTATTAPDAGLSLTGTRFEGVSEGGRGDGFSAAFPVVQLRSLESERRHVLVPSSWSTTSYSVTNMPAELPTGQYWLWVTVGGAPSTARLFEYFFPLSVSPSTATLAPRATRAFSAAGGNGVYGWSLSTNNSGATLDVAGNYQAGATGGVTDVVRLTDGQGRTASATITVGPNVSVSPATANVAPRASRTFTASGGSGTGFAWSLQTNNSGGAINPTTGAYTAGATGGVMDVVRVIDSLMNEATATVTVTAGVSIAPVTASVPPRGSQTFTVSGGSGAGFTWQVLPNNSGGSITAGGVYTAGATGNVTDTVVATDSLGNTASVPVSVTSGVSINPPTASTYPMGPIPFSASAGSGTGYAWSLMPNNSGGSINPSTGAYLAGATEAVDTVRVQDSLGNSATATVTVTNGLAVTPSSRALAPRATQVFSATGGSGMGYTWVLLTNDSGATFVPATATYTAGPTGGTVDTVQVTDSAGNRATATITVTAGVTVAPATASVPPRGGSTFTAAGGSNAGFTWSFATNASGGSIDAMTGIYTAGSTGGVTDVVQATDSLGNLGTRDVTVTPGITIGPLAPSVAPNGMLTLTAMGGSGTGYVWTLPSAPSGGTINPVTGVYRAGATGGVSDQVRVVDNLGNEATGVISVTGDLAITPANPTVQPGGAVSFSASGGSGTGFTWALVTNASQGSVGAATGQYLAGPVGNVVDVVEVTDSLGNRARTNVTVGQGLTVSPTTTNVAPRESRTFTVQGGTAPYTFALVTNGSQGTVEASTGVYTAGVRGGATDVLEVTDAVGLTARATITVTAGVTITPPNATLAPGATQAFTASGGTDTGFTWTVDTNLSGGTIDAATGAYQAGPTGGVTDVVLVTDSVGNTAIATVSVLAVADQTPFAQRPPVSGWSCGCGAVDEGVGLVPLLGLALLALGRRRRGGAVVALVAVLALPVLAAPAKKKPAKTAKPSKKKPAAAPATPAPEPVPAPVTAPLVAPAPAEGPAPGPAKPRKRSVAVLDVEVTVPDEKLDGPAFTEMVVNSVSGTEQFTVMSARDVATILGIERQKQLLGCADDSSCMAEIANAMGSDFVLATSVGKVGDTYLVSVKLVDGQRSRIAGRASLQADQANALLGAVWRATQQALDAYGAGLDADEAQKWASRPKQEPPAALTATMSVPNYFGVTLLAVGGLQVLSEPGRRGSIGAQVDVTWRRARLDLSAGVIIGPNLGARISAGWALIDRRFRLGLGLRGTAYPGLVLFGGGVGVTTEFALSRWFGLTAIGAAEVYPAPGTPVVALLGSLGATARF